MTERFESTTTVRQPRVVLMWSLVIGMVLLIGLSLFMRAHFGREWGPLLQMPWWVIGPALAGIQRRPKIQTLAVAADAEGLRVGSKAVPRAKLKSAVLRREGARTFVLLRGKGAMAPSFDVEVPNDEAADRLCGALALDAKSTTAEFLMFGNTAAKLRAVVVVIGVLAAFIAMFTALFAAHYVFLPLVALSLFIVALAVAVPFMVFMNRTKLLVGADGLVVKEGLRPRRFISHEDVAKVSAEDTAVIVERKRGEKLKYTVGTSGKRNKQQHEELRLQAQSIAWRIEKAREAYRALAGQAPQAALALDRGGKSTREWIDQLKRIGEGANATFRSVGLTREQLLRVVESTSASAMERLAAAVALRTGLTEEEKPRIRVAAERCVEPALRERMVRVAFAPSDEELAAALEDEAAISADASTR